MNPIRQIFFVLISSICIIPLAAQNQPAVPLNQGTDVATNKIRFDLALEMLKGYYDGLESHVEKTIVLLIGVIGWLITSDTARKSLASQPALFKGTIATLTLFFIFYGVNIYHFLDKYQAIQKTILDLNYVEPQYIARYQMPSGVFLFYLSPMLIFYVFILIMLFQIRKTNKTPEIDSPVIDSEEKKDD